MYNSQAEADILDELKMLRRLFIETIRGDCEEPDIIDLVLGHYKEKMGGTLSLEGNRSSTWSALWWEADPVPIGQEPTLFCCAAMPIPALRGAYAEWKEMHAHLQSA